MNKQPFVIERTFDAPLDMVWAAITDRERMKEWYFEMDAFVPEVGCEFRFSGCGHNGEKYLHLCQVLEVSQGSMISYSWRYDNHPGNSVVKFELFKEEGNRTRLKLTHAGLESFDSTNPDFAPESFADGWAEIIGNMLPKFLNR
ncbi:MAG: SRPBCC domain-containing protein [Taibaiella sp.]|nr:SRPBCC domain-containing protein [Taibaiella sp.]